MPNALIALPDVYESVTRRVASGVTAQLARTLNLPGDTDVYLPGSTESVPMNGGSFGECWDPKVRYPNEARLVVKHQEEFNEQYTLTTPVQKQEHMPLFRDEERDITIHPVYRYVNMTATLEYTAPSRVIMQRWLDDLSARISMGRAELYQNVEYHYAIPDPVNTLLSHLHETMEASRSPTGKTFDEYLLDHLQIPTTVATTLSGTTPTRVVTENQYEILGWFDFTTRPQEPERDSNEGGSWTATVTYTFGYNRPMQVYCTYPMVVHQKPIDQLYRPQKPYETFRSKTRRVSTTKGSFDDIQRLLTAEGVPYVVYPDTDDWIPNYIPKDRLTFFSGLLVLDESAPRDLMDLSNLGTFSFTPYFLEYIMHQGNRLFGATTSIFEFRLYENRTYRDDVGLSIEGVTVKADRDLDPTRYYHLQISFRRNWLQLTRETIQDLRRYPKVAYWALRALGITLPDHDLLGSARPRPGAPSNPGEGGIIGPPAGTIDTPPGWDNLPPGTWPWPWLGDEWADVPWPGLDNSWGDTPWPQLENPNWPGVNVTPGGVIPNRDMEEAVIQTNNRTSFPVDRVRVGPVTVLYVNILTMKRES